MQYCKFNVSRVWAFTLIEILVVISVIGLLIALLLPAVQSARESARRLQCTTNLRAIGVAIHGYASQTGVLPRGEKAFSIQTAILPLVEQSTLYDSINFSKYSPDLEAMASNKTAECTKIALYLCPSDSFQMRLGGSNYGGNWGVGLTKSGAANNGPFASPGDIPPVGLQHISDGTSQTAGMAEFCRGDGFSRDVTRAVLRSRTEVSGTDRLDRFVSDCLKIPVAEENMDGSKKGETWMSQAFGQTLYNHTLAPNERSCTNKHGIIREGAWTAGSQHPGGANVLFLDGHVLFENKLISLNVWRAIGTMNNNEAISGDEY